MEINKSGFTLIELLAVVLIIGLLTSMALPQYKRTIRRAEAMEALVNLRTVYGAAKRYKAATSEPPTSLNGLDTEFFDAQISGSTFTIGKFIYTFSTSNISACRLNTNDFCIYFYYNHNTLGKDAATCVGNTSTGQWICNSLGINNNYGMLE